MAAANSFLQGFSGGMGAMSNVMNYKEQREQRQRQQELQDQQMQDQENLRYFSAVAHGYKGMDDDQRNEFQQVVVDKMNADPGVQKMLARNVGHNEQKRISSKFGNMTRDGFVPYIDVVDGRTGKVLRTAPMTEFGTSDANDKPVAISPDNFMKIMGAFLGKDDFGRQAEIEILRSGGSLPDKGMGDFKEDTWTTEDGTRIRIYPENGKKMMLAIRPNGESVTKEVGESFDFNTLWNGKGGNGEGTETEDGGKEKPKNTGKDKPDKETASSSEGDQPGLLASVGNWIKKPWTAAQEGREKYKQENPSEDAPIVGMLEGGKAVSQHISDSMNAYQSTENRIGPEQIDDIVQQMRQNGASDEDVQKFLSQTFRGMQQ